MNKAEYLSLALALEVGVTDNNTVPEIKDALCDALIEEREGYEEEITELNAELNRLGKAAAAKAVVVSIGKSDYKYIGKKHLFSGEEVTAERLINNKELAKSCLKAGVGFLIEL